MIKPKEIQQKAGKAGVRDTQIEKDYMLSWILKGVAQHEKLSKLIVFKGGTVLKKIYFEDYRFSEDLDFTLIETAINNKQIFEWFNETFEYVLEESNIPLEIIDNNEHEDGGINFYITYLGPLGGESKKKRVKVDISRSEKLEFDPVLKPVFTCYSDLDEYQLLCYQLEEVLIEKMRSVMQRMQPRDFYDLWYLLQQNEMDINFCLNEFVKKCLSKNINSNDFPKKLSKRMPQYKGRWKESLGNQIQNLPDFDRAEREVQTHLRKVSF
jgi:uncharacterized protein